MRRPWGPSHACLWELWLRHHSRWGYCGGPRGPGGRGAASHTQWPGCMCVSAPPSGVLPVARSTEERERRTTQGEVKRRYIRR
eukprot:2771957-Alexandrium_andersonii.AAC.1